MRLTAVSSLIRSQKSRFYLGPRFYSVRVLGSNNTNNTLGSSVETVADLKNLPLSRDEKHNVEISGWVRNVRKGSGVRFVEISDGSSMRPIQAVVGKDMPGALEMRLGAAVCLKGVWQYPESTEIPSASVTEPAQGFKPITCSKTNIINESKDSKGDNASKPARNPEVLVNQVEILAGSDPSTYPIQKKYTSPETLRQMPHFRMRTPLNSTILRLQSEAMASLTRFFADEQFTQMHTPIITTSDCEGAGEVFTVVAGTPRDPFFNEPKYLTVSAQLHLEAMAQSLGNVWTLSPTFRAERSDTSRHLSEFYMLEAELSFVNEMEVVMDFVQKMLTAVTRGMSGSRAYGELNEAREKPRDFIERRTFDDDLDPLGEVQRRWNGLLETQQWPSITYLDAIKMLQEHDAEFQQKAILGEGLKSEHERWLAKKLGFDADKNAYLPVFVTHYPKDIKAFYMRESRASSEEDNSSKSSSSSITLVDCFDLLVPDVGELAGGSMREHQLDRLASRVNDHTRRQIEWYMELRKWGCPPHGGFGVGFDRLLSYMTGVPSVRDIVPFPRLYGRVDC